jgi:hypothetical protein
MPVNSGIEETVGWCGVCETWTSRGTFMPSGNRDPRTGQTPHDNFVCDRCQKEASDFRVIAEALRRRVA